MSEYNTDFSAQDFFDPRGTIMDDIPCRRCSYNLRGLQQGGRCPECGTPIGVSVCGDLLRFCHPRWLRQVAEGLSMILWGMLATVLVALSAAFVFRKEPAIAQFLTMLASLIGAWGTWQMTTPDPSGIGESDGVNARKLVRAAVCAGLAAAAVQWLATAGRASLGGAIGLGLFQAACGIVGIIGEFAKLQYIGRLADRIPDPALSSRANTLKWGMAICYGLMLILGVIVAIAVASAFTASSRGPSGGSALGLMAGIGCLMAPVGIAMLVMAIMTIILIYRMGQAVRLQVPLAIQIWSRAAAAVAQPGDPTAPPAPTAQNMRPRF